MSLASNSESYGQKDSLIPSIRNILKDYSFESIFKEFLQNADDAGATRFHIIIDGRSHPTNSLLCDKMKPWQGPAILIFNDAKFKESDFESLMQLRVGGKQNDDKMIGKHGLGFNSCYHFTDVPSFISGDFIAFLDPQEKFLPLKNDLSQRGIICPLPKKGIRRYTEKDQLVPFENIEGVDFRSTFEGTLFRIPLRQNDQPSEISDDVFSITEVLDLFNGIKSNISSQLLFLRNIEKIQMSHVKETMLFQMIPLWQATINELGDNTQNKRNYIAIDENQIFQIEIELIDDDSNMQMEQWMVATGAQNKPEDSVLKKYAERHRLRVIGGVAILLKRLNNGQEESNDFDGRIFSFFPLPDTTYLPVHLNGTWAQGSDRGRLLLEKDDLPDLDHQKLGWNRHILLEFLPELHFMLLKEISELEEVDFRDRCISKLWPFPSTTRKYPKYIIGYSCKVLQLISQCESIAKLITSDNDYFDSNNVLQLLQNNWDEIGVIVKQDFDFKTMISSLPVWPVRPNYSMLGFTTSLVPASVGYILPKDIQPYRTNDSKFCLEVSNSDREILKDLDIHERDICSYISEDIEFPEESDEYYVEFLNSALSSVSNKSDDITQILKEKVCFPVEFTNDLKRITDLYNYENAYFRTVFGNSNVFLNTKLLAHATILSKFGFNNDINQESFIKCALKVQELQDDPPYDIRNRGLVLVEYFYESITKSYEIASIPFQDLDCFENTLFSRYKEIVSIPFQDLDCFENTILPPYKEIASIPFVPIEKRLGECYNEYYNYRQVLDCFENIILPQYKEIAWSQKPLIAVDVVPPHIVLISDPSFGEPDIPTVLNHLRFLRNTLINDIEWKERWKDTFTSNVFEVYKWLDKKSLDKSICLKEYIEPNEALFLNFNKNEDDPFDTENWASKTDLVLNCVKEEGKYVNPRLAKYHSMLRSAGIQEIKLPDYTINVTKYDFGKNILELLSSQVNNLHDVIFIVNGEKIWANQYILAANSKAFRREFTSRTFASSSKANPATITIDNYNPNSVRILLHYLYNQNIDTAIQTHKSLDQSELELYKDLAKLANKYELTHLKELMELKLSRLVNQLNMEEMERLAARDLKANQLKEYC
ncbi:9936_t:CDS:2, partial [Entrophospora sp. SA101]